MKIAFCVITKDDNGLDSLKKLVESALPAIDTVHITANHKPYTKIKAWCKKEGYDFSYLKWKDDFSEQRNFNFARVPKDTDYILWADTDDVIINAPIVREIARIAKQKAHDTVFFTYFYASNFDGEPSAETFIEPELVHMRERLIRPRAVEWKKRIHETPVPLDPDNFSYTQIKYSDKYPVAWLHLGAERNISPERLRKRTERNKRLLEMELADERAKGEADPRTLLYTMKIYAESEDPEVLKECIELGEEYLGKSGWDEERAQCCKMMASCMGKLGDNEGAKKFLHEAIKEYPHSILLYLHLARVYFNLQDYRAMKHWMDVALSMKVDDSNSAMNNIIEHKAISAELLLKYYYVAEKDVRKAYDAARLLNKVDPTPEHAENLEFLGKQVELDKVCENAHNVMRYYEKIRKEEKIPALIRTLPKEIQELTFARRYYARYKEPRIWKPNEICYFANFGRDHYEQWDGNTINEKGLGGSETAVIRLAEEWTKMGYSVVVYGDPKEPAMINGVLYIPYQDFAQRDKFNIFIQWRHNSLAGRISAKKFMVDLHDVTHSVSYMDKLEHIDKIMVKSEYHRTLLADVPDDKFLIISNGI